MTAQTTPRPTRSVDSILDDHAAKIEKVYQDRTAGDSTFLGLLTNFLIDLSPVLGKNLLLGREVRTEPVASSVVMIHGENGTAYQRLTSDDLWHSVTGRALTWTELLAASSPRLPVLRHDAAAN